MMPVDSRFCMHCGNRITGLPPAPRPELKPVTKPSPAREAKVQVESGSSSELSAAPAAATDKNKRANVARPGEAAEGLGKKGSSEAVRSSHHATTEPSQGVTMQVEPSLLDGSSTESDQVLVYRWQDREGKALGSAGAGETRPPAKPARRKRKRGRPRKKNAPNIVGKSGVESRLAPKKRRRGRPRKSPPSEQSSSVTGVVNPAPAEKKGIDKLRRRSIIASNSDSEPLILEHNGSGAGATNAASAVVKRKGRRLRSVGEREAGRPGEAPAAAVSKKRSALAAKPKRARPRRAAATRVQCTICNKEFPETQIFAHPLLSVAACESCVEEYENCEFQSDDDGDDQYCRWTMFSGELCYCDECNRGFLIDTLEQHLGQDFTQAMLSNNEAKWRCLVCDPSQLDQAKIRRDWPKIGERKPKQPDSKAMRRERTKKQTPKKKKKKKEVKTGGRYRRNIKKVLKDDELDIVTRKAMKLEAARANVLAARRERFASRRKNYDGQIGGVILNPNHLEGEDPVFVSQDVASRLKPHQIDGLRFMWDVMVDLKLDDQDRIAISGKKTGVKSEKDEEDAGQNSTNADQDTKAEVEKVVLDVKKRDLIDLTDEGTPPSSSKAEAKGAESSPQEDQQTSSSAPNKASDNQGKAPADVDADLKNLDALAGGGCILAHLMGLGKTLQAITLVEAFLRSGAGTHVMVVTPVNVLTNWVHEFEKWFSEDAMPNLTTFAKVKPTNQHRLKRLRRWKKQGGVLILGMEMMRRLCDSPRARQKTREAFRSLMLEEADLVVIDEGHRIRNSKSGISRILNQIGTPRRLILTGTPMQNNLMEYYCMVDFVKPDLLGTETNFRNRFQAPILNGQCVDSTPADVSTMRSRAFVLYNIVKGFVHRRGYNDVAHEFPSKHVYTLFVSLSKLQRRAYKYYVESIRNRQLFKDFQALRSVWNHPAVTHAAFERERVRAHKRREHIITQARDNDFFVDSSSDGGSELADENSWTSDSEAMRRRADARLARDRERDNKRRLRLQEQLKMAEKQIDIDMGNGLCRDWFKKIFPRKQIDPAASSGRGGGDAKSGPSNGGGAGVAVAAGAGPAVAPAQSLDTQVRPTTEQGGQVHPALATGQTARPCRENSLGVIETDVEALHAVENGPKFQIVLELIDRVLAQGEKILVFSQSLLVLDLLEQLMGTHLGFAKQEHYFRLDGTVQSEWRQRDIDVFNSPRSPQSVFLLSTRAGSLGINLVGANHAVIFDSSWNPSHDLQAIYRIYRFGQPRDVFVYRLIARGTMEQKIYERQLTKRGLALRVIDERQVQRIFKQSDLQELYKCDFGTMSVGHPEAEVKPGEEQKMPGTAQTPALAQANGDTKAKIPAEAPGAAQTHATPPNLSSMGVIADEKRTVFNPYEGKRKTIPDGSLMWWLLARYGSADQTVDATRALEAYAEKIKHESALLETNSARERGVAQTGGGPVRSPLLINNFVGTSMLDTESPPQPAKITPKATPKPRRATLVYMEDLNTPEKEAVSRNKDAVAEYKNPAARKDSDFAAAHGPTPSTATMMNLVDAENAEMAEASDGYRFQDVTTDEEGAAPDAGGDNASVSSCGLSDHRENRKQRILEAKQDLAKTSRAEATFGNLRPCHLILGFHEPNLMLEHIDAESLTAEQQQAALDEFQRSIAREKELQRRTAEAGSVAGGAGFKTNPDDVLSENPPQSWPMNAYVRSMVYEWTSAHIHAFLDSAGVPSLKTKMRWVAGGQLLFLTRNVTQLRPLPEVMRGRVIKNLLNYVIKGNDNLKNSYQVHTSEAGRVFYYNKISGKSSWAPPLALKYDIGMGRRLFHLQQRQRNGVQQTQVRQREQIRSQVRQRTQIQVERLRAAAAVQASETSGTAATAHSATTHPAAARPATAHATPTAASATVTTPQVAPAQQATPVLRAQEKQPQSTWADLKKMTRGNDAAAQFLAKNSYLIKFVHSVLCEMPSQCHSIIAVLAAGNLTEEQKLDFIARTAQFANSPRKREELKMLEGLARLARIEREKLVLIQQLQQQQHRQQLQQVQQQRLQQHPQIQRELWSEELDHITREHGDEWKIHVEMGHCNWAGRVSQERLSRMRTFFIRANHNIHLPVLIVGFCEGYSNDPREQAVFMIKNGKHEFDEKTLNDLTNHARSQLIPGEPVRVPGIVKAYLGIMRAMIYQSNRARQRG